MKNLILSLITLLITVPSFSQAYKKVKVYDEDYRLIDFEKEADYSKYESIYLDTARYAFAPISYIPNEVLLLTNLKSVSFTITNDSAVKTVFDVLQEISTLESLSIEGSNFNLGSVFEPDKSNSLSLFPIEINRLVNLKTLMLTGHFFNEILIDTNKLNRLENLYLFRNKLTEFPKLLLELPKLVDLGLENNYIKEIPTAFCNSKIIQLSIGRNRLSEIPECIFEIDSFKMILLNENMIPKELADKYLKIIEQTKSNVKLYLPISK